MTMPRLSIATLMAVVALVALNAAAARALWIHGMEALAGFAPIGLLLQAGLIPLVRCRGRARASWAGFLAGGLLAMASLAWAMMTPPVFAPSPRGAWVVKDPGSTMHATWEAYFDVIDRLIPRPPKSIYFQYIIITIILFLPQCLVAAAGGVLTRLLVGLGATVWPRPAAAVERPAEIR